MTTCRLARGGQLGICITDDEDIENDFQDGYCTIDCSDDPNACPQGSTCAVDSVLGDVCLDDCAVDGDCRAGYSCHDLDGDGNTECVPGNTAANAGDGCESLFDCVGAVDAVCLSEAAGFTGGLCAAPCSTAESQGCEAGFNCTDFQPFAAPDENEALEFCLQACQNDAECLRDQYQCLDVDNAGGTECLPGSADGAVASACDSDFDCLALGAGAFCVGPDADFPDGYCSVDCDDLDPGRCGNDAHCAFRDTQALNNPGACAPNCANDVSAFGLSTPVLTSMVIRYPSAFRSLLVLEHPVTPVRRSPSAPGGSMVAA